MGPESVLPRRTRKRQPRKLRTGIFSQGPSHYNSQAMGMVFSASSRFIYLQLLIVFVSHLAIAVTMLSFHHPSYSPVIIYLFLFLRQIYRPFLSMYLLLLWLTFPTS